MGDANHLDFAFQVRLNASGFGDADSLWRAFLEATFYCQAPQHPGFLATQTPVGPVIAVFTSETGLTRHCGPCRWFSTSGADLLATAPVGHRFVIDPGSRHQLVVDPARFVGLASGPAA
jgi:hypothetical protein